MHLVGGFIGSRKEPKKALHKGGPRYEIEVRLLQGKYQYKFILVDNGGIQMPHRLKEMEGEMLTI